MIYTQWRANSNSNVATRESIREAPPQVVELDTRDKTASGLRAPKQCEEAVISHLWQLTSDVLATTTEFETEKDLESYLLEAEDPIEQPAKYAIINNYTNNILIINLMIINFNNNEFNEYCYSLFMLCTGEENQVVLLFMRHTTTLPLFG